MPGGVKRQQVRRMSELGKVSARRIKREITDQGTYVEGARTWRGAGARMTREDRTWTKQRTVEVRNARGGTEGKRYRVIIG